MSPGCITRAGQLREPSRVPRLMLVTDRRATGRRDLLEIVAAAVAGGVDAVQVREKDLTDSELTSLLRRVQQAVQARAAVLVNGRPGVAKALGAGLHLPGNAPGPAEHDWPLWGRSVHSPDEAQRRAEEEPDYLLVGPIYPTGSKPGHPGGGLRLVEATARAVAPLPVLAIGGIDAFNAGAVVSAGAAGVAVRGAILEASDPERTARSIHAAITEVTLEGEAGVTS